MRPDKRGNYEDLEGLPNHANIKKPEIERASRIKQPDGWKEVTNGEFEYKLIEVSRANIMNGRR